MTTPAAERWLLVKALTADALERPAAERAGWVAAACGGDGALRAEVESLLAADAAAGAFLDHPGIEGPGAARAIEDAAAAARPDPAGRVVGPYRIVRELGRGGMGVVYLAERADSAYEKLVAIKVVRGGLGAEPLERRFEEERRILAALDHPNIARLLDAGATGDGLPYLVMEYVDGTPIDDHARAAGLGVAARVALFADVCAAVGFAHQRLVLHRDLKARNILVTAAGAPKLLDFGIAKLMGDVVPGDEQTRTGLRLLSLEGASPEQVRGEPLSVTSDVYSLGVLLYRLLTGRGPYGAEARTDADRVRAIVEEVPPRPSAVARPEDRRAVRGELDWIAMKALRKEPERRYASVEQLSDDLARHLTGRPVAAGPDSFSYRARKFAARNRTGVAASVVVTATVIAGVTATLWQARRAEEQRALAERRFADTRKLAASVMGELHDAIRDVPGATAARALLLKRATEHLDALARDAPGDPALAEEVATAYHRLGEVQSSVNGPTLGDDVAARASHAKALALRQRVAGRRPGDLEAQLGLASSLTQMAYADAPGAVGVQHARAAVAALESVRAKGRGDARWALRMAAAHFAIGAHHRSRREQAPALAAFQTAAGLYEGVRAAHPKENVTRQLALSNKRLGAIVGEIDAPRAPAYLRRAVALDEANAAADPRSPVARRDLSVSLIQLGWALQRVEQRDEALAAYRRAIAIREAMVKEDAHDARAPGDLAVALWTAARLQTEMGDPRGALLALDRAERLLKADRGDRATAGPRGDARILAARADAYERLGRVAEAVPLRERVHEQRRAALAADPGSAALRKELAFACHSLGATLARLHRWREARAALEEGLSAVEALGPPAPGEDARTVDGLRADLARADAALVARR